MPYAERGEIMAAMTFQSKPSNTVTFRSLRNRRFAAAGRVATEFRKYFELVEELPDDDNRVALLREQLAVLKRASAIYDKLHQDMLRYLEQHPEMGLLAQPASPPQREVSQFQRRVTS